jgi:GNAT superfamily N-acetyltransferase
MLTRSMIPGDHEAVVALLAAMQAHYGVPCPPARAIRADLAALPAGNTILLACDPAPVGFAAVAAVYPGPGLRAGLFLKELFVARHARGRGAGRALMRAVAAHARAHGCARVDWTAAREDARLTAFYGSTGALAQPEKLFFRLAGDALARLADEER